MLDQGHNVLRGLREQKNTFKVSVASYYTLFQYPICLFDSGVLSVNSRIYYNQHPISVN